MRGWSRLSGQMVVLILGLLAIAGASFVSATPARAAGRPGHQGSQPTVSGEKPQITGLIDKGSESYYDKSLPFPTVDIDEVASDAGAFSSIVVNETWAQLEPKEGTYDFEALNASLAAVTTYNHAHPTTPLRVKLRIWPGLTAPEWAKTLNGTPINVRTTSKGLKPGTDGRWWASKYRAVWSSFQHVLADHYDTDPLIGSVAVASCASLSDEPFNMAGSPSVLSQIVADGWTNAAQQKCLEGALADYSGWRHTPIDYTFNAFKSVTPGATHFTADYAIANKVMALCADSKTHGGPLCILSNHGLTENSATGRQSPLYAQIDSLWQKNPRGTPVDFQQDSPSDPNLCVTIGVAVAHHAQSDELWPPSPRFKGFGAYSESTLAHWNSALKEGTVPSC